jgi:4-amino-4-deoxy-L-arabinose transferase-like glycosyltransferase
MHTSTNQYKAAFFLSWITIFLIYPAWALPIPVMSRLLLFSGLLVYFCLAACLMNVLLKDAFVEAPLILPLKNLKELVRQHVWLLVICSICILLHIYPISYPILLDYDEEVHLQGGLAIYKSFNGIWQRFSNIPIQYIIWIVTLVALIMLKQRRVAGYVLERPKKLFANYKSHKFAKPLLALFLFLIIILYFSILRNLPYQIGLVRFPPIAKILYFASYLFAGITHIGPRLIQSCFCVLGAVYLYRTIILYRSKETALLGASIWLFSPLVFYFSNLAELACGTIFFIIIISFYLLRFMRDHNDRDLLLLAFFIGVGFLYKRSVLLMLSICAGYFIIDKLIKKDLPLKKCLKILSLSLVPIIPWLVICKIYVYRNYEPILSNFISIDTMTSYAAMIPSQISWPIVPILICSAIYVLSKKRDHLTLYFVFLFLVYYLFYTADKWQNVSRFTIVFYPSMAILLSQFIIFLVDKFKWKHSYKCGYLCFIGYLICICTILRVPPLEAKYTAYKDIQSRYFPANQAMKWIKENVIIGERILIIRMSSASFYRDKYGIERNKIVELGEDLSEISTPAMLKEFCRSKEISYILFLKGLEDRKRDQQEMILNYLKENRNNDFTLHQEYNLDGNYIYIVSLAATSEEHIH